MRSPWSHASLAVPLLGALAVLLATPWPVLADNCSGLVDCWSTAASAAAAAYGAAVAAVGGLFWGSGSGSSGEDSGGDGGDLPENEEKWKEESPWEDAKKWAVNEVREKVEEKWKEESPWEDIKKRAQEFSEDFVPSAMNEVRERVEELYENTKDLGEEVFKEIADEVADILDTGEVQPQTDGHLGETHDIMTPEAEVGGQDVGFDVGTIPGMGSGGAGMSRDAGSDSGGSGHGGGGSGSVGTTPLGESGGGEAPLAETPGEPPPPTYEDVGLDQDSGAYIEYQPSEGQVQITYPDGTVETRPWPPQ